MKEFPPRFSEFFAGKTLVVDKYIFYDPDTFNAVITIEDK